MYVYVNSRKKPLANVGSKDSAGKHRLLHDSEKVMQHPPIPGVEVHQLKLKKVAEQVSDVE